MQILSGETVGAGGADRAGSKRGPGMARPRLRLQRLAAAALVLCGIAVFAPELRFLTAPDPRLAFTIVEELTHGVVSRNGATQADGVVPGVHGFDVPPGTTGRLRYQARWEAPAGPWSRLGLAGLQAEGPAHRRVRLSVDGGQTYHVLAENRPLGYDYFDVGQWLEGRREVVLLFEMDNRGSEPASLVSLIVLQVFAEAPRPAATPGRALAAVAVFGLAGCLLAPCWLAQLPLLGILLMGFLPRYLNFLRVLYAPPEPDAAYFRVLASKLRLFSDTGFYSGSFGFREPFFLLVAKGSFLVFGESDTHLRFVSLAASLLAIALAWRLGRRLLSPRWGWLPAAGLACSVPLIVESGRGLRLEVEMVLLLLFVDVAFTRTSLRGGLRAACAGVLGGLLVLTRSSHLPGLVLLTALAVRGWGAGRQRLLLGGLAVAVTAGLYLPHAAALARLHGDPFYDQATHSRWFANMEFAGQRGFPSKEEVARNAYAGPRITFPEYLFALHTPAEVAVGYLRGFAKMLFHMELVGYTAAVERRLGLPVGWLDWVVRLLAAGGLLLAALGRQTAWLAVGVLALNFPVAFQYDRGVAERYRFTLVVFPFVLLGIGLLFERAAAAVVRLRPKPPWRQRG